MSSSFLRGIVSNSDKNLLLENETICQLPGCPHAHEVLVARRRHVLEHVRLVEDDVVEVELAEEDAVVGRADHHVVRCQDDVKLDLLVHNLN